MWSCNYLNDIRVIDKYGNFCEKDNKAIVTYQKKFEKKKMWCMQVLLSKIYFY